MFAHHSQAHNCVQERGKRVNTAKIQIGVKCFCPSEYVVNDLLNRILVQKDPIKSWQTVDPRIHRIGPVLSKTSRLSSIVFIGTIGYKIW